MKFSIGAVYSDSITGIRKSPALLLPVLLAILLPALLSLVLTLAGVEFTSIEDDSRTLKGDEVAAIIVSTVLLLVINLFAYAWLFQAAAAAVREGQLAFDPMIRLVGGRTLRVALSLAIVGLAILGGTLIAGFVGSAIAASAGGTVAALLTIFATVFALWTLFSLVPVACACEASGPVKAIAFGTERTRRAFWSIAAFLLLTFVILLLLSFIISVIAFSFFSEGSTAGAWILTILNGVIWVFFVTFVAVALTLIYRALGPEGDMPPGRSETAGESS